MTTGDELWHMPPDDLVIGRDEVHVWRACLSLPAADVNSLAELLSNDELQRAQRFRFAKDRDHFVIARGALRTILSRYLQLKPTKIRLRYNSYGKPSIAPEFGDTRIHFNLAHSHELVAYAISWDREVGIDVEFVCPDLADANAARQFFSPGEVHMLSALPPNQRMGAFFDCWTRKEAYVKAKGQGLSIPLQSFDVALLPGRDAALLRTEEGEEETHRWCLRALDIAPRYAAALAVEGHTWRIRYWQFQAGKKP